MINTTAKNIKLVQIPKSITGKQHETEIAPLYEVLYRHQNQWHLHQHSKIRNKPNNNKTMS